MVAEDTKAAKRKRSPAVKAATPAVDRNGRLTTQGLSGYLTTDVGHGSIATAVAEALREAILDGALAPATWLRESDIAAELGVSRTPVREAISRLQNEGLVSRTANSGAVVASLSLDDIIAVYAVREALEATAARLVASTPRAGLLAALEETYVEMEAAIGTPAAGERLGELNLSFHARIRDASGNAYLRRFLLEVEHAVRRFRRSGYDDPAHMSRSLSEHRSIIDAIASGDAELAAKVSADHMRAACEVRIRDYLAEMPGFARSRS